MKHILKTAIFVLTLTLGHLSSGFASHNENFYKFLPQTVLNKADFKINIFPIDHLSDMAEFGKTCRMVVCYCSMLIGH